MKVKQFAFEEEICSVVHVVPVGGPATPAPPPDEFVHPLKTDITNNKIKAVTRMGLPPD